jgi:hypothetical protein
LLLPRILLLLRTRVNKAFKTGAIPGAKAHKGAGLRGRGEKVLDRPLRHGGIIHCTASRVWSASASRTIYASINRLIFGEGYSRGLDRGHLCGHFRDYVGHSRGRRVRRGRRGAATTLLGPYLGPSPPAIGPSRALHGLPGGAPRTEVGRRGAVGPSQYPDSRVDSIQAVAWGKPLRISFPTLQGARTPSFSEAGAGKAKGGYPRPGIGSKGSSLQAWEVRAHRSYG